MKKVLIIITDMRSCSYGVSEQLNILYIKCYTVIMMKTERRLKATTLT